jgi:TPR repeat protein
VRFTHLLLFIVVLMPAVLLADDAKLCEKAVKDEQKAFEYFYQGWQAENEHDLKQAITLFHQAACYGHMVASYHIGLIYDHQLKEKNHLENALTWYTRSAKKGYDKAQLRLAQMYQKGHGTQVDVNRALVWFEKAAQQGNIDALLSLGHHYEKMIDGKDMAPFYAAIRAFKKAKNIGSIEGMCCLSLLYLKHNDSYRYQQEGKELLLKAAKKRHAKAQYQLAMFYGSGDAALSWMERSAHQNYAPAQYQLGSFYIQGNGVKADNQKAFSLIKSAADQGLSKAQYDLGLMYYEGLGTDANKSQSYHYWTLAQKAGDKDAEHNVKVLCQNNPKICQ